MIGIAPKAKILPIRDGIVTTGKPQFVDAINYAVKHGANVICIAQGAPQDVPDARAAIAEAENANVIVIAAAGNNPNDRAVLYPAAYPGVVAAAGTDEHGNHAAISVTGPQITLAAPSTNIVSTYLHNGYSTATGTSASTAIIAGAAALVRSKFPNLSAAEVVHRLEATAIDKGPPGRDDEYGYGELNIIGALTATVPPLTASPTQTTDNFPSPTSTVSAPKSHGSTPWLPLAAVAVALIAAFAVWTAARRGSRN